MSECDVVIVGAGPAGASAALVLARAGRSVALLDRCEFPRDKTCGDALIPDALETLDELGLLAEVRAAARPISALAVHAPSGGDVALNADALGLRRVVFDHLLVRHALAAGARPLFGSRATALRQAEGGHRTVELDDGRTVTAPVVLIATGARTAQIDGAGQPPVAPNAMAARTYVTSSGPVAARLADTLTISYHDHICPGYGWVVPMPGGVFNVGVGYATDVPPEETNLRRLYARFTSEFAPARELLAEAGEPGALKGAPLRTGLEPPPVVTSRVLPIGEAAALTYPATGEGIGKAMTSGIRVAGMLAAAKRLDEDRLAEVAHRYSTLLSDDLAPWFRTYGRAQRWLARPGVCDSLVALAGARPEFRARLEGLVSETVGPAEIFTAGFMLRCGVAAAARSLKEKLRTLVARPRAA